MTGSLLLADGLETTGLAAKIPNPTPVGLDGPMLLKNTRGVMLAKLSWKGTQIGRVEIHDQSVRDRLPVWARGAKLPHYHRRPGIGAHRPWEGRW